eukprot:4329318-Prymnesium_polylepis.1
MSVRLRWGAGRMVHPPGRLFLVHPPGSWRGACLASSEELGIPQGLADRSLPRSPSVFQLGRRSGAARRAAARTSHRTPGTPRRSPARGAWPRGRGRGRCPPARTPRPAP